MYKKFPYMQTLDSYTPSVPAILAKKHMIAMAMLVGDHVHCTEVTWPGVNSNSGFDLSAQVSLSLETILGTSLAAEQPASTVFNGR